MYSVRGVGLNIAHSDAGAACVSAGCDGLATIIDADESPFLVSSVSESDLRSWIGLNDLDLEGAWQWESGLPVSYTDWAPGEPNDDGSAWCTAASPYGDGDLGTPGAANDGC